MKIITATTTPTQLLCHYTECSITEQAPRLHSINVLVYGYEQVPLVRLPFILRHCDVVADLPFRQLRLTGRTGEVSSSTPGMDSSSGYHWATFSRGLSSIFSQ